MLSPVIISEKVPCRTLEWVACQRTIFVIPGMPVPHTYMHATTLAKKYVSQIRNVAVRYTEHIPDKYVHRIYMRCWDFGGK